MMRNDPSRLAELRRLLILDSTPEQAYDDITRLLASSLEVPIVLVSLLDQGRDWHKSVVGLPFNQSPAVTSLCESFFQTDDDLIVVPDTTADPRFSANPLVVHAPYVRFYAAARLTVRGQLVGTLCGYDMRPRTLCTEQIDQLRALAGAVVELLAARPVSV